MVKVAPQKVKKARNIDDMKKNYVIKITGNSAVVKYSNVILTKLELDKGEGEDDVRVYLDNNQSIFTTGWNKYSQSVSKRRTTLRNNSIHRKELKNEMRDRVLGDSYKAQFVEKMNSRRKRVAKK